MSGDHTFGWQTSEAREWAARQTATIRTLYPEWPGEQIVAAAAAILRATMPAVDEAGAA